MLPVSIPLSPFSLSPFSIPLFRYLATSAGVPVDDFVSPFTITSGSIGDIVCEIPWSRLSSRSVEVKIRDLFLVLETTEPPSKKKGGASSFDEGDEFPSSSSSSPSSEQLRANNSRHERSRAMDEANKSRLQKLAITGASIWDDEDATGSRSTGGFGQRLAKRVLENVEISVENVHIRVQNKSGVEGSVGFTLKSFKVRRARCCPNEWSLSRPSLSFHQHPLPLFVFFFFFFFF